MAETYTWKGVFAMDNSLEIVTTPLLSLKKTMYSFIKRLFDIVCSLVGIIFLIPLSIIIKISYILMGDFHSIFFTQNRIGKNGKEFKFFKFRTMVVNADEVLFKLLKEDKEMAKEYKKNRKLKNDPRITKLGKILRRTSIDELPQLINVFLGNMTMIGNRPYLPREKEDMGKYYKDIIKTKPGITGYWQVSGKKNATFQKRLELESFYSKNCGLKMDIKIFFKTFGAVVKGHGAEE